MEKQDRKQEPRREPQGKEEVKANPKVVEAGKKLKEDIDKLVDEIDDVLETNAEEFVKTTCKKGGSSSSHLVDLFPHFPSFSSYSVVYGPTSVRP